MWLDIKRAFQKWRWAEVHQSANACNANVMFLNINLQISSVAHNIIKTFEESGGIKTDQNFKTDSVTEITPWAQEHLHTRKAAQEVMHLYHQYRFCI